MSVTRLPILMLWIAVACTACDEGGRTSDADTSAASAPVDVTSVGAIETTPGETTALDDVERCTPTAPQDTRCDGVDEDCDGATDEDFAPMLVACGPGACEATATSTCDDGRLGDLCVLHIAETDATCDGVDDDCDGATDEEWIETSTTCGRGACARGGVLRCRQGAPVDTCVAGAAAEGDATCDGIDDDCDGASDEDHAPVATQCGRGACAASGVARCIEGRLVDDCAPGAAAARDATCDGVDDDCDGIADEDYAPVATSCGEGACSGSGLTTCDAGEVDAGCGTAEPRDADCDGVDDDCDGDTDEDYVARVSTCGVGACAARGTVVCRDGGENDDCTALLPASRDATCDGVDDDCDGTDDEDVIAIATTCGKGPCARAGVLACRDARLVDTCVPGQGATSDTTCDGFDDDCSGTVDEDYVAGVSSCGVGACAAQGTTACATGGAVDVCTPRAPACAGLQCGDDGCGGSCGTCAPTGLVCLVASCGGDRQCHTSVAAGRCFIGGACWDAGQVDPSGACGVCDPARATDAWSVADDLVRCDDHDATTWADWCWAGACRGFEERMEQVLAQSPMDWFDVAATGPRAPGLLAAARTPTAAQTFFIHLTTYGAAIQGVTKSLGSQWLPGRATPTAPGLFVEENKLWEWIDGEWINTPVTGSLRAAWPGPSAAYARFDRLLRLDEGGVDTLLGVGRTASNAELVVRRCTRAGSWACTSEPVHADQLATTWTAGLVLMRGEPLIVANDKISGATKHRVLRKIAGVWTADPLLDHAAGGKGLVAAEVVGGGGAPEWLVGTLVGGGLLVRPAGPGATWTELTVPGVSSAVLWDDIRAWQGYALVLGRVPLPTETVTILARAPLGASLADPMAWRWTRMLSTTDRRRVDALGADDGHLFMLGSSPDATTERRTIWRFEVPAPDGPPIFAERFDTLDATRWFSLAQGTVGQPMWRLDDGALQEIGNHHDGEADASALLRLGSVLWAPTVSWGSGRLTVAVRATDDDGWGVQYAMQGADRYYRVSFDRERTFARLVRIDRGVVTVLAQDLALVPAREHWHLVEVVREGGHHEVRLDGAVVLTADDATWGAGAVGLYAWSMSSVRFDDLRLYAP